MKIASKLLIVLVILLGLQFGKIYTERQLGAQIAVRQMTNDNIVMQEMYASEKVTEALTAGQIFIGCIGLAWVLLPLVSKLAERKDIEKA